VPGLMSSNACLRVMHSCAMARWPHIVGVFVQQWLVGASTLVDNLRPGPVIVAGVGRWRRVLVDELPQARDRILILRPGAPERLAAQRPLGRGRRDSLSAVVALCDVQAVLERVVDDPEPQRQVGFLLRALVLRRGRWLSFG
jgi:hypothetical protein